MRRARTHDVSYRQAKQSDIPQLQKLQDAVFPLSYGKTFYSKLFTKNHCCIVATLINTTPLGAPSVALSSAGPTSDIFGKTAATYLEGEAAESDSLLATDFDSFECNDGEVLIGIASGRVAEEGGCFGVTKEDLEDADFSSPFCCLCNWMFSSETTGYIMTLGVDSKYRSQGIGGQLLERLCKLLFSMGCSYIYLHVKHDNLGAIKFYSDHNFIYESKITDYYFIENKMYDAFKLVRRLEGPKAVEREGWRQWLQRIFTLDRGGNSPVRKKGEFSEP